MPQETSTAHEFKSPLSGLIYVAHQVAAFQVLANRPEKVGQFLLYLVYVYTYLINPIR